MIAQAQYEGLQRAVFATRDRAYFAVLDGAQIEGLPERLRRDAPDAMCLFSGQLDPLLEAAAPHLLSLKPDSAPARIALQEGWNQHWSIVLAAEPGVDAYRMRAHLRRCLRVVGPNGDALFFRFYDPRAFRTVVPTMKPEQRRDFFGPILGCWVEGRTPDCALFYSRDGGEPRTVALAAG